MTKSIEQMAEELSKITILRVRESITRREWLEMSLKLISEHQQATRDEAYEAAAEFASRIEIKTVVNGDIYLVCDGSEYAKQIRALKTNPRSEPITNAQGKLDSFEPSYREGDTSNGFLLPELPIHYTLFLACVVGEKPKALICNSITGQHADGEGPSPRDAVLAAIKTIGVER